VTRTHIFHVIGTLEWAHIELALESMHAQVGHWDRFVLYNGGDFSDWKILDQVDRSKFDSVELFRYDPATPKGAMADWEQQIQKIGGSDIYLVHKADFYLPSWIWSSLETVGDPDAGGTGWVVNFNKFACVAGC